MGFRPRIIPCLLLQDQGLVKTRRFEKPAYIGDPLNTVRIFNDLQADELVFLDITAQNRGTIQFELLKRIAEEAFMPFSYGGGISSIDQVSTLVRNGVEKVIINSAFFKLPNLVVDIANRFGSQAVSVCIDYRIENGKAVLFSHLGKRREDMSLHEALKKAVNEGSGEIILSSIDRDGTLTGYDLEVIELAASVAPVPVIALGGARDTEDFLKATQCGASAAAAGATFVFMGGPQSVLINYPDKMEIDEIFGPK